MNKTAADILEIAADLYESETVNWCQRAWVRPSPLGVNACAVGAMSLADGFTWQQNVTLGTERIIGIHGSDQLREAVKALEEHLSNEFDTFHGSIPRWNDADDRTKEEVIEAMKETAKGLRNREVAA